ncbi:MAG: hydantoinase/oxoprolinase family protein, partial [Boseongicola sp.]|nr:hydantoinase/oxoprolinase family protein [Boseongicola sp.]
MTRQEDVSDNSIKLGIDIGGTFTDAAIEVGDRRFTAKTLTTHTKPDDGVISAMEIVLAQAGVGIGDLDLVVHGTTLATNALIERKGAKTAMLTTAGFRDVVEIGQEYRFDLFDLFLELPAPLVPRDLRIPIRERLGAGGRLLMPLDETDVATAIDRLKQNDVESVAVCLMHSYANTAHEARVADMIRAALPDVSVSISGEVAPEMREFERFCTACANAYVQPKMAAYLLRLEERLKGKGMNCPLLMMLSGGGLTDIATAAAFPIRLVESGPAGGALFSASIAAENGLSDVVSFDMGGTTAKLCLIDNGKPQTSRTFEVARVYKHKKGSGTPVRIPVIDMVEIGSGGGSLAKLDTLGRVAVGPESAGSEPGPAAFGRGGNQPAVTDANLLLGRINPSGFAGGEFPLDNHASETAMTEHICKKLAASTAEASAAVLEVVEENMASAARVHAVESGKEIRNRVLIGFGGGAPLHVANVMAKLGMKRFLVPMGAGVGSAVGFLRAPVSYEVVRSLHQSMSNFDADAVNPCLEEMKDMATRTVEPAALG